MSERGTAVGRITQMSQQWVSIHCSSMVSALSSMNEWMNEWNEWNEWMEWMKWMNGMNEWINQSINQSINLDRSIDRSNDRSINQSIKTHLYSTMYHDWIKAAWWSKSKALSQSDVHPQLYLHHKFYFYKFVCTKMNNINHMNSEINRPSSDNNDCNYNNYNITARDVFYLSIVYCWATLRQNSAAPRTPQDIPYRALFRQPNGP